MTRHTKMYRDIIGRLHTFGKQNGYIRTLWKGYIGRLMVACVGITNMIETTEDLKKLF